MKVYKWHEESISNHHDRAGFDCGEPVLNDYLVRHARQNHERNAAKTFLAVDDTDNKTILGFYSLSPASIQYAQTPDDLRKGLARHEVPVFRLARLAVSVHAQGAGLGGQLILAAGRRCILVSAQVGGVALLIDAKNQRVCGWYKSFGAIPLLDSPLSLVLALSTVRLALEKHDKL
jgi:GNAT superfamily N-acetyltransferase